MVLLLCNRSAGCESLTVLFTFSYLTVTGLNRTSGRVFFLCFADIGTNVDVFYIHYLIVIADQAHRPWAAWD